MTTTHKFSLQALDAGGPVTEAAKDDSDADDDDDTCEEWERHEALHNDVQANRTIGRQVKFSVAEPEPPRAEIFGRKPESSQLHLFSKTPIKVFL